MHYLVELAIRVTTIYGGITAGFILQKWSNADKAGKWLSESEQVFPTLKKGLKSLLSLYWTWATIVVEINRIDELFAKARGSFL